MYERLKAYKRKHGNCLVPNRYPQDTQLGSWVSAQRRQYKIVTGGGTESAAMTPERAKKLRDLGFEWSTTNPRNVPWETRFKELKNFVACYGHAEVPMRWEENPQLSNWVSKQRHQYKLMQSNRPSRLNMDKVNKLNKIGFVWEASRRRLADGGTGEEEDESESDNTGSQKKPPRPPAKSKVARKRNSLQGSITTDASDNSATGSARASASAETSSGDAGYTPDERSRLATAQNPQGQGFGMTGQAGALPVPANYGLWAAMNQATILQNQAMAVAAVDPRVAMQMNAAAMMAFGGGAAPMGFNPAFGQIGPSILPQVLSGGHVPFRPAPYQSGQDPPGTDANQIENLGNGGSSGDDNADPE